MYLINYIADKLGDLQMNEELLSLVNDAKTGEREAVNSLLIYVYKDILYTALSFSNKQEAEDIAQEAMQKIAVNIRQLKHSEYFKTWMYKIVRNLSNRKLMKLEKIIGKQKHLDDQADQEMMEDKIEFLPEEYIEDAYKQELLMEAINALQKNYKEVILLRYFNELSHPEIAEVLSVDIQKVRNDLIRARKQLKKRLESLEGKELVYSMMPISVVPVLSQTLKAYADNLYPPERLEQLYQNAITQLEWVAAGSGALAGLGTATAGATSGGSTATVMKGMIVGTVIIAAVAGYTHFDQQKVVEPVIEEKQRQVETEAVELEEKVIEAKPQKEEIQEILTLADMIGTAEAQLLEGYVVSQAEEAEWLLFLEQIGAKEQDSAYEEGISYTRYLLEKRDKRLVLACRKEQGSSLLRIAYWFGDTEETEVEIEHVVLYFTS